MRASAQAWNWSSGENLDPFPSTSTPTPTAFQWSGIVRRGPVKWGMHHGPIGSFDPPPSFLFFTLLYFTLLTLLSFPFHLITRSFIAGTHNSLILSLSLSFSLNAPSPASPTSLSSTPAKHQSHSHVVGFDRSSSSQISSLPRPPMFPTS